MVGFIGFRHYDAPLMTQFSPEATQKLGKRVWVVTVPFTYYIEYKYSLKKVNIPLGFLSDGASVPKFWRWLLPPWGRYGQACVVHDYLCEHLQILWSEKPFNITRQEADKIFLEAMKVLNVPSYIRYPMYWAVSLWTKVKTDKGPSLTKKKTDVERALLRGYMENGYFK